MSRIIGIGNAPSSGSTLLADLLDSTNCSAVGPELNLFAIKSIYQDYNNFKNNIYKSSKINSLYCSRVSLITRDLPAYGLDKNRLYNMLNTVDTFEDFFKLFAESFLALRGKSLNGVVFEKTPQNIANIRLYLEKFDMPFIHIVRNPIDVYLSLLKRNIPRSIALLTWFTEQVKIIPYLSDNRLIIVKYEDLVENPFHTVSALLFKAIGIRYSTSKIQLEYENNYYRKYHSLKLKTWKHTEYGVISKKNRILTESEKYELKFIYNLKISEEYAKTCNTNAISFMEIIERFGYRQEFENIVPNDNKISECYHMDYKSALFLLKKLLSTLKYRDFNVNDVKSYFQSYDSLLPKGHPCAE